MEAVITSALRELRKHQVPFTEHEYRYEERGGTRVASRQLALDEHAIVKTLVMEDEARSPLLVLMHGDRKWRQFWVGGDGTVLQLAGAFAGNVMTLESAGNRIRFTRNADGTVRQQWDSSTDGGKTWKTVFDGKYVRSGGTSGR